MWPRADRNDQPGESSSARPPLAGGPARISRVPRDGPATSAGPANETAAGTTRTNDLAAAAERAVAAPQALRRDEIITAFHLWGRVEPEAAFAAAVRIADGIGRDLALQSVFSGWARENPAALANTALAFPEGAEKDAALTKAIRAWMIADPQRAGDWVFAHTATLAIAERVFRDENR